MKTFRPRAPSPRATAAVARTGRITTLAPRRTRAATEGAVDVAEPNPAGNAAEGVDLPHADARAVGDHAVPRRDDDRADRQGGARQQLLLRLVGTPARCEAQHERGASRARREHERGAKHDRPHRRRSHASETSRPPVIPDGRRIRTSAISAPRKKARPLRQVEAARPVLGLVQERVEPADEQRADDGAPQARAPPTTSIASVRNVRSRYTCWRRDRAEQVHEQAAGEARERAPEHERVEPLAVHVDADRTAPPRDPPASRAARRPNRLRW